ncbi:MAG TPA: sulfate reduction electron transfer complex DsrMKJOP subunit DsrM [Syntrophorhabdaceae bacterium]|nr:sulfate reduction electron transfer complex DsrMKJOP subunit DsrM [Syntrophorhabdaceae bacterium]
MKIILPFFTVVLIACLVYGGTRYLEGHILFGIIVPYICFALAIVGFVVKIVKWAVSPVPFNITTVCGQQKSLNFLRHSPIESPASRCGVFFRMLFEVLFFRSLLRNEKVELYGKERRLIYGSDRYLWIFAILFHWSMLIILLRHLKLFLEPIPHWIIMLQSLDGIFQSHIPPVYISNVLVFIGLVFLFLRRLKRRVMYISLPSDFFVLFLIGGVIVSGMLLRYVYRADILLVKAFLFGLIYLNPIPYTGFGTMFYTHLCLISVLIAYLPYSKLMHMAGVFLSPTRNLRNDSRARRYINPWNYPVKEHTYKEWEEEFKDALKEADIPLDSEDKG